MNEKEWIELDFDWGALGYLLFFVSVVLLGLFLAGGLLIVLTRLAWQAWSSLF